jgi:tetratricopeptide (TPR) repeat protein
VKRWLLLLFAALGCSTTSTAGPTAGRAAGEAPQPLQALRVRVADDIAIVAEGNTSPRIGEALKSAVEVELARRGLQLWRGSADRADMTIRIETRVKGAVFFLRGHVGLTAERTGAQVASTTTDDEIHREAEFPSVMAERAVGLLLRSPAMADLAERLARRRAVPAKPAARPAPAVAMAPTPSAVVRAPSPEAQARSHHGRATSYYNLGRYQEALTEYEAAYLAVQDPPFLFNIAQCQRKMGRDKQALGAYRSYLRVAPNAPNRSDVQKRIAELEREHEARPHR